MSWLGISVSASGSRSIGTPPPRLETRLPGPPARPEQSLPGRPARLPPRREASSLARRLTPHASRITPLRLVCRVVGFEDLLDALAAFCQVRLGRVVHAGTEPLVNALADALEVIAGQALRIRRRRAGAAQEDDITIH